MRGRGQNRHGGFTLVEVLVSTMILGIGLVALAQLYLAAMWTYQKSYYMSLATQRAQQEYEKVQNLGFYALENGPDDFTYLRVSQGGEYEWQIGVPVVRFSMADVMTGGQGVISWTHWPPNTVGNANMLKVEIEVTWVGPKETLTPVKIVTLVTN